MGIDLAFTGGVKLTIEFLQVLLCNFPTLPKFVFRLSLSSLNEVIEPLPRRPDILFP